MWPFPKTANANAKRLVFAKGLRAVADGYVSILLPAYLLALGFNTFEVGVLTTATLLGSAALTLLTGMVTARFGHRLPLLAASALMAFTGIAFAGFHTFWPLLAIAFIGTLNPSAGDVSVFLPLEQSLLAESASHKDRTELFSRYSLAGALMGAGGTLLAVIPGLAADWLGGTPVQAMRLMFLLYAATGFAAAMIYRRLSEPGTAETVKKSSQLGPSRGIVYRLTVLFSPNFRGVLELSN